MSGALEGLDPEIVALLEKRAERLRARSDDAVEEAVLHVAEFRMGKERLCVPLVKVRACLPLRQMTAVPLAPPAVIGLFRYDGELLPAYSLSALLGGRGQSADPTVLLILDRESGGRVAVDCEMIPKASTQPQRKVEAARGKNGKEGRSSAVVELPDGEAQPLSLLDIDELFRAHLEASRVG